MADIAKPGWLAIALLVEPRLGIGRAGMRFVGALLLVDVALGVGPGPSESSSPPSLRSLRRKLLIDPSAAFPAILRIAGTLGCFAHASISVPSTEKWSLEISRFTFGWARTAGRNFAAISSDKTTQAACRACNYPGNESWLAAGSDDGRHCERNFPATRAH